MIIISRTPVRISFFGGGTDYPDFYNVSEGAVLGTTINKFTHVSINTISPFFSHKIRIGYSKTELVSDVEEIQHPSIRECLKFYDYDGNLDIHIFSDLPARTGLGSSSSFTVGFLNALYALNGKVVHKQQLAEEACYIEQSLIKENVGSQDQFHASYGGLNVIEFNSKSIHVRPVVISKTKRALLDKHLLVFYTGLTRHASEILKEQITKTKSKTNNSQLNSMLSLVYEAENIISNASNNDFIQEFGILLDKSWQLKKQLSSKISNDIIDQAYIKAKAVGAYGGKLCGAGNGGFLALLVPQYKKKAVREALKDFLEVSFMFEDEGSKIIYMKH
jgi:D-glycero-alpha-D-manno-heptose-7-phosphate kinase